jgi:hypothetical protein
MYPVCMATIYERFNKDGSSTARVQIRRKGLPVFSITFSKMEEATKWVKLNEYKYINDPDLYLTWIKEERINLRRKREFER